MSANKRSTVTDNRPAKVETACQRIRQLDKMATGEKLYGKIEIAVAYQNGHADHVDWGFKAQDK